MTTLLLPDFTGEEARSFAEGVLYGQRPSALGETALDMCGVFGVFAERRRRRRRSARMAR